VRLRNMGRATAAVSLSPGGMDPPLEWSLVRRRFLSLGRPQSDQESGLAWRAELAAAESSVSTLSGGVTPTNVTSERQNTNEEVRCGAHRACSMYGRCVGCSVVCRVSAQLTWETRRACYTPTPTPPYTPTPTHTHRVYSFRTLLETHPRGVDCFEWRRSVAWGWSCPRLQCTPTSPCCSRLVAISCRFKWQRRQYRKRRLKRRRQRKNSQLQRRCRRKNTRRPHRPPRL